MNLFKIYNRKKFSNVDLPSSVTTGEILNLHLAEDLANLGLFHTNNHNKWFGEFNAEGIKPVLCFTKLKGLSATFRFGNCFNFVPTITQNQRLTSNASAKATTLQVFDSTDPSSISLWNERELKRSLLNFKNILLRTVEDWYTSNQTLIQNVDTLIEQLNKKDKYILHAPNQQYVLAFLYAKLGEHANAEESINTFFNSRPELSKETKTAIKNKLMPTRA